MAVPDWVQDAIFYHIFPDRFANGDPTNDPPNVHAWGSMPTSYHFQGGDFQGIIDRFDYLLDLGITAVYLNPIFLSPSNHRYNTVDYYRIDPKLGDMKLFRAFLTHAQKNGVRVILDGVFNHCGRGFFAFNDLLENQANSPYQSWFHPVHFPIDAYSAGESKDYLAWWGFKSLPKFNTNTPAVRKYIFDIARYWVEQGIDGWRLDVPNEIDDDSFWAEFRHTVKSVNPDAYLVGEIWKADPRWVGEGHFDGLMNYPVRECLLDILNADNINTEPCMSKLEALLSLYPRENVYAMYVPLGSHDTERILTLLDGDVARVKLALLFQFAYPGAPVVFYGDEIGLIGGRDPACRVAFPWDEKLWNHDLRELVKLLISLRKRYISLRRGEFLSLMVDDDRRCYAFARKLQDEQVVVLINASSSPYHVSLPVAALGIPDGRLLADLLGKQSYPVSGGKVELELPAREGVWLA
jgi:glycosidase